MLVSIIFPVYNGDKYIDETITSILSQTYKNFELICIDDRSTDESLTILNKYQELDKRVKVYQTTVNGGTSVNSIIYALTKVSGSYMFYTSQDDIFSNDLLEKMISRAKETNADAIIPDMAWYNGNYKNLEYIKAVDNNREIILSNLDAFSLSLNWDIHGFSLRKMNLVKKIGYDTKAMNSDEYITRKFYLNCNKVAFSAGVFYYRQDNPNAITKQLSSKSFDFVLTNIRLLKLIEENKLKDDLDKFFIINCRELLEKQKTLLRNIKNLKLQELISAQNILNHGYFNTISIMLKHNLLPILIQKIINKNR